MDTNRRRSMIIAGVVAASMLAAVLVAVLLVPLVRSGDDEYGTDAHHAHPEPSETAEGAASAAIQQIFSWRPADQAGPWDALHAASESTTGKLAEAASERPVDEPLPPQWSSWASSGDVVIAATERTGQPVDPDASTAQVPLILRQVVQHADGSATPMPEMTVAVDMVRDGFTWRAAEYRFQP